ncbi:hypothetical protein K458DRAFT_491683 [Lentithecium fluviatile CBS 122367]|uniref:Uncharacterized protein n=1 Tax=Lentithecium fluviatile CBS 122367 TaxID=1168545 RepID=A0A6G1IHP7_9PLEO|nr:hypothetical protein K458DRAFT_491683 [Lentithecium fluviatile CBS 122367]
MRTIKLTLFLLGLLALFATSAPVDQVEKGVGYFISGAQDTDGNDGGFYLTAEEVDVSDDELEKRAPKKAKKPAPKKHTPTKTIPKKPKKPAPKKATPAQKPKKPTSSPKPKKCTRADNNDCGKTRDYEIAEAAAKKKKKTLQLNHSYLLRFKDAPATHMGAHHAQLVVGTVRKNADGELDFDAVGTQLLKDESDPSAIKEFCKTYWGAKCEPKHIRSYKCQESLERNPRGRFKFEGEAAPEFAVPSTFFEASERLIEEHPNYKVIFNDCKLHATRVKNIAIKRPLKV